MKTEAFTKSSVMYEVDKGPLIHTMQLNPFVNCKPFSGSSGMHTEDCTSFFFLL